MTESQIVDFDIYLTVAATHLVTVHASNELKIFTLKNEEFKITTTVRLSLSPKHVLAFQDVFVVTY